MVSDDGSIQSFMDLRVWQEGMGLVEDCYVLSGGFPKEENYGLTAQLRRSAVSVPANIAEGYGRENIAEGYGRENKGSYLQHLKIVQGSLRELQTHILIAQRLRMIDENSSTSVLSRCETVAKMLNGLIRSLQRYEPKE